MSSVSGSSQVLAFVRQLDSQNPTTQGCDNGKCIDDSKRAFESVACENPSVPGFTTERLCTEVSSTICDIPGTGLRGNPSFTAGTSDDDLTVTCSYDAASFTNNHSNIVAYYNYFGRNEFQGRNIENIYPVMDDVCFQEMTDGACLPDYTKKHNMSKCARIFHNSDLGSICYNWYLDNPSTTARGVDRYCEGRESNDDCACYFKEDDEKFRLYKASMPGVNPSCYWLACSPASNTLKKGEYEMNPVCPSTVCSQVAYISAENNITYASVNQQISCSETFSTINDSTAKTMQRSISGIVFLFIIFVIVIVANL